MIERRDDFRELLDRLQDGDESAAEQIVDEYGPHLINAIRRRVRSRRVRLAYSTEDCLQSVWGSIFAHRDRVAEMESPEHLMRFLARVATNKLIDKQREVAGRNQNRRETVPLPGTELGDRFQLAASDPTPSAMVSLEEEWEAQIKGLSEEKLHFRAEVGCSIRWAPSLSKTSHYETGLTVCLLPEPDTHLIRDT